MEAESPSTEDVRKFLKDADLYDDTLSNQEMLEIYQALVHSHKTASEEELRRNNSVSSDADMTLEELQLNSEPVVRNGLEHASELSPSTSSTVVNSTTDSVVTKRGRLRTVQQIKSDVTDDSVSSNTQDLEEEEEDEQEIDIDVFPSNPSTCKLLKMVNPSAEHEPPIYCNPKLAHLDVIEKACLIADFHMTLLEKYRKYQRRSRFMAPWGKPIQGTVNFKGHLEKKMTTYDELEMLEDENKSDSEEKTELYTSKSGRVTKRKLYIEDDGLNWLKRAKSSPAPESSKKAQQKKRQEPLLNDEIIKKSKIFSDHNRNVPVGVGTRAEKMFDSLLKSEEKKQEAEKEMEKFNETIEHLSDDDFIDVEKEEPFLRRRVVPPSQVKGRSALRGRGRGKKTTDISQQKYEPLQSGKELSKGVCPICSQTFFETELFDHASRCEGSSDSSLEVKNVNSSAEVECEKMTCEDCDEVFNIKAGYKEHIKNCQFKNKK